MRSPCRAFLFQYFRQIGIIAKEQSHLLISRKCSLQSASRELSQSSPTSFPAGAIFRRIASACPPPSTVPSITKSPGRGSSILITSCKRTGICILIFPARPTVRRFPPKNFPSSPYTWPMPPRPRPRCDYIVRRRSPIS